MNSDDLEELIYRRIADKVTESVDKQIKRRYFWAALLFAGVSWFGGAALVTSIVQSRVAEKMEPAQQAVVQAKLLAEQLSAQVNELRKNVSEVQNNVSVAKEDVAGLTKAFQEAEGRSEKRLADIQSDAGRAVSDINERMKSLGQASPDLKATLDVGQITIRASPDVPSQLITQLGAKIRSSGKYTVTIEGGRAFTASSSLRYYYDNDRESAKDLASIATDALKEFGINNKALETVPLTGMAIKPPERTLDIWLNVSAGKLL